MFDPLNDTVHMKVVTTFARKQAAVVSWVFAGRTSTIKMYLADPADVVVGYVPSPCSYCIPRFDLDLHLRAVTSLIVVSIPCRYMLSMVAHDGQMNDLQTLWIKMFTFSVALQAT